MRLETFLKETKILIINQKKYDLKNSFIIYIKSDVLM